MSGDPGTGSDERLERRKEIRIEIPMRQHLKLRAIKLFTDRTMSQTIQEALDGHLDRIMDEEGVPMIRAGEETGEG